MGDRQYDLIMQNDTNSSGYTQWYNFIISNDSLRGSFTFRIVNFVYFLLFSIKNIRFINRA